MDMNQATIEIRDLGLAAALVSRRFKILDTRRDMHGRAYFLFEHSTEIQQTIVDYRADTLEVSARHYSDNLKMLKSIIYSEK